MPTGNESSDVRFGQNENSYNKTDREMSGLVEIQIGGPNASIPVGNYPNTFDLTAGSEPLGTSSEDNPFYYPERVFERIDCTGPGQSYVTTERESISGEFTTCHPMDPGPYPGNNMVPDNVPSKQFSSKGPETHPKGPQMNAFGNNILGPVKGI